MNAQQIKPVSKNPKSVGTKQAFILSLLLLFTAVVFAQSSFNIGVKAGINSSTITEDNYEFSSEPVLKMHAGLFARYGGILFVQSEGYYSGKGTNMASRDGTDTKFNLNEVNVPVLFGLKLLDKKNINLRVLGGPVFCFILSKSIDYEHRLYSPFDETLIKDNYKGIQYGASIGFGKFSLDARLENGIDEVYQPSGASYRTDGFYNSKSNSFMLSLGYIFF